MVWCVTRPSTTRRRPQCSPDKKENHEPGDHKQDTTSGRTDCTEPPPDYSNGSYSTSRLLIHLLSDSFHRYSGLPFVCSGPLAGPGLFSAAALSASDLPYLP